MNLTQFQSGLAVIFSISVFAFAFAITSGCGEASTAQEQGTAATSVDATTTTSTDTDEGKNMDLKIATFGGGCFWCVESVFLRIEGVEKVRSGYMGGAIENPTYKQVCSGTTGHAEIIEIQYDPEKVNFEDLLAVFYNTHDPTTLNRQGNDVGTQYRSVVFYHDDQQRVLAETTKEQLNASGLFANPIVTEVSPASTMYVAEDYHQDYFNSNPNDRYCNYAIPEKLEKLKKLFSDKLKDEYKNK
jgi:peptide-methionine (S)-S-oxide reductase